MGKEKWNPCVSPCYSFDSGHDFSWKSEGSSYGTKEACQQLWKQNRKSLCSPWLLSPGNNETNGITVESRPCKRKKNPAIFTLRFHILVTFYTMSIILSRICMRPKRTV